jgi:hypothetical protein
MMKNQPDNKDNQITSMKITINWERGMSAVSDTSNFEKTTNNANY